MLNSNSKKIIVDILKIVKEKCDSLIRCQNDIYYIHDPNDEKSIKGHYADSHAAVAYLIHGIIFNDDVATKTSLNLIYSIIKRWNEISSEKDFHADFNLFAICLYVEYCNEISSNLLDQIKSIVFNTKDSPHNTINWLPMRIYVNIKRYEWSNNKMYLKKVKKLLNIIMKSTYSDFYIDDRYPRNISYNIQYNIATVASLYLINQKLNIKLDNYIDAILKLILYDGDINYLGRGCNQIFAWGPMLYIITKYNKDELNDNSLEFFQKNIYYAIENDNLFLNRFSGNIRWLWWDYHHFSVYISHLFLWLELALYDKKMLKKIDDDFNFYPKNNEKSGLEVFKNKKYMIVSFKGRNEYISERGPAIYAISLNNKENIFKGMFGPWYGAFGNNNVYATNIILNYFGLIELKHDYSLINHLFRRFNIIKKVKPKVTLIPKLDKAKIITNENELTVEFFNKKSKNVFLNLPSFCELNNGLIKILADNNEIAIHKTMEIYNQYGDCNIYQTPTLKAKSWKIIFNIGEDYVK